MGTKKIPLTRGRTTLVDDLDFEALSKYKWYLTITNDGKEYAYSYGASDRKYKGSTISMHKFLLQPELGLMVDHINGNGLDNTRKNLRVCTHVNNTQNAKLSKANTTGFKGVSKVGGGGSRINPWRASIKINGKFKHLGNFPTVEDAHNAYKKAASSHFGEFARFE